MHWIAVALGGAVGALVRYSLSGWVIRRFPMGTFVANLAGCLLIGLMMALTVKTRWPSPVVRSFLIAGFLGSLTTFSTFAYQTWELGHAGELGWSSCNVFSNLIGGLLLVWLGVWLGETLCIALQWSE